MMMVANDDNFAQDVNDLSIIDTAKAKSIKYLHYVELNESRIYLPIYI